MSVLVGHLTLDFGITGHTINLRSFVTDPTQYVGVVTARSSSTIVECTSGVPRGSVLESFLSALYVSPISNVITAHSVSYHQYVDDDTQFYVALQPNKNVTFKPISECTDDVNRWFVENNLLLNLSKTEATLCGTRAQCNKVNISGGVEGAGTVVKFSDYQAA